MASQIWRTTTGTAHAQTTAYTLTYCALLQLWHANPAAAQAFAQRGGSLAREQGFPIWQAGCDCFGGAADVSLAQHPNEALQRMQAAADVCAAGLSELYAPYLIGLTADAQRLLARLDDARTQIDTAVLREAGSEQRVTLAELHRLRALVMQAQGEPAEAVRQELQRAVDLAVAQGAGLWEQRARATLLQLQTAPTAAVSANQGD